MNRNEILKYRRFILAQNSKGDNLPMLLANSKKKKSKSSMMSLFDDKQETIQIDYNQFNKNLLTDGELMTGEREVLGVNLLNVFGNNSFKVDQYTKHNLSWFADKKLHQEDFNEVIIGAVINKTELRLSQKGNYYYKLHVSDNSATVEIYCKVEMFQEKSHILLVNNAVFLKLKCQNGYISIIDIKKVDDLPYKENTILNIKFSKDSNEEKIFFFSGLLDNLEKEYIKSGPVQLYCNMEKTKISIELNADVLYWIENSFGLDFEVFQYKDKSLFIDENLENLCEEYDNNFEKENNDYIMDLLWK